MKHDPAAFRAYGAAAAREGSDVADRVRRFMPLVRRTAWHIYGAGRDGLELDDLVQAGLVALTECAARHTGPTEDGFAAYAKIRVRGAMVDCLRRSAHTSRTARRRLALHDEAVRTLRARLKRQPDRAEIAAELGLTDAELLDLEASAITLTPIAEEYDETSMAFASDDPDPFEVLCAAQDRELLIRAMTALPDRLKLVLQLFFVEELNLTEIAGVLEVSVPRVHQLRAKALQDVRKLLEAELAGE
ncbi:MAG: sigma-70 family RNA polymerase sigma factor [Porphyrobacter sp.]|nr:sigma-70 family RNA polymerase sigma factor [Porphyrobacter sp.]